MAAPSMSVPCEAADSSCPTVRAPLRADGSASMAREPAKNARACSKQVSGRIALVAIVIWPVPGQLDAGRVHRIAKSGVAVRRDAQVEMAVPIRRLVELELRRLRRELDAAVRRKRGALVDRPMRDGAAATGPRRRPRGVGARSRRGAGSAAAMTRPIVILLLTGNRRYACSV